MGREIDAECARLLGWQPCACGNDDCDLWAPPAHLDDGGSYKPFPRFSTDPTCVSSLLAEIERRGGHYEYVYALFRQVDPSATASSVPRGWNVPQLAVWAMLRATPEQHARAFVEVMSVHDED